jgi:hypothetical protein
LCIDIVVVDLFKLGGTGEDAEPDWCSDEIAQEYPDPVEPAVGGGHEVEVELRMVLGACVDLRSLRLP